ncbi:MAG: CDP-alcohol phosphatidyltransferase family protein [Polyangia bacterium]|nr:CDP-alcohol phosphatidyltransferase family protein [Polyangia bacterium]
MRQLLAALLSPPDRLLARVVGAGFGLKDIFTLWNLAGGVASICLSIMGELWWASFAVMLGYLGDVLDGPVARLTGRMNRFGGELDNIADHTTQCVAPAFVVFLAYKEVSVYLGFGLAALLVTTGSIRHARAATAKFDFALAWHGMPRPVAAFLTIAFLNSQLFQALPGGRWVGVGLVGLVALLNLAPLPFLNHHGRRLQGYVVAVVVTWFVGCAVTVLLVPKWFWDVLLACVLLYAGGSWVPMSKAERRGFFEASRRWRQELESSARGASEDGQ